MQILLNVNRGEHVMPFELEQVMQWLGHAPAPPPPQRTPEELAATIQTLHGFYRQSQHANGERHS